jgi:hypothetical protein
LTRLTVIVVISTTDEDFIMKLFLIMTTAAVMLGCYSEEEPSGYEGARVDTLYVADTLYISTMDTTYITLRDTVFIDRRPRERASIDTVPRQPKRARKSSESSAGSGKYTRPQLFKMVQPAVGTVHVSEYSRRTMKSHQGSGFFVASDGRFVTNDHVIPSSIFLATVKLHNGAEYPIEEVLARDENADLLLVSVGIPADSVKYLNITTTLPKIGEDILVIGSPKGLGQTVTKGIVSSVRTDSDYGKVIQIDAPISPGSSGSPVLTMDGAVIGVATFKEDGEKLNFAVPGKALLEFIQRDIGADSLARHENPFDDLMVVKAGVKEMVTLDMGSLDSNQVRVISQIFDIPRDNISKFRWGPSLAPPPHQLAGSTWYTVWYRQDETQLSSTVRIDSTGSVIE